MACKGARRNQAKAETVAMAVLESQKAEVKTENSQPERLLFGVDSQIEANDVLQNNITVFEWATRNKMYPNFWGRNIAGENCLTKAEIDFLHRQGCFVAPTYSDTSSKDSEEKGKLLAKKVDVIALELGIPEGTAIFLEIGENETVTGEFIKGFGETLALEGYTPGFKANTDAKFDFDREFSRAVQNNDPLLKKCIIWAVAPSLKEYDRVTTTHLIHPDNWGPFAPSVITRNDIAIWQYGKNCHPINDDAGKETTFNVNLIRDDGVIVKKLF